MLDPDKKLLQSAIMTLADPKGNWDYAWKLICDLAGMDPAAYKPHFAKTEFRTELLKAADISAKQSRQEPTA